MRGKPKERSLGLLQGRDRHKRKVLRYDSRVKKHSLHRRERTGGKDRRVEGGLGRRLGLVSEYVY